MTIINVMEILANTSVMSLLLICSISNQHVNLLKVTQVHVYLYLKKVGEWICPYYFLATLSGYLSCLGLQALWNVFQRINCIVL